MMTSLRRFAVSGSFAAVLAMAWAMPMEALAQYAATQQVGVSYPALTNPIALTLTAPGTNDPLDKGRVTVPLGFDFPFYTRTYSQVTITANGVLFLEPSTGANSDADFPANVTLPNGAEPNGVIAPFWDDLAGSNPTSALVTQAVTGVNGQGLAIEFKEWNRVFGAFSLTFQVRLWANGVVEFFYGTMTGSGATNITATIGIESGTGTASTRGLTTCNADCSVASFDPGGTGSPISYIKFGPPTGVDVQALSLKVDGITTVGSTLNVATTLSMRNFGTLPSGEFTYAVFLSQDTLADVTDLPLSNSAVGPFSLRSLEVASSSSDGGVLRPDGGAWYVLATLSVPDGGELNPFNNTVASSVPYAAGVDLVAEAVTPPPVVGPGDDVDINVRFSNQGFESAGAVQARFFASVDTQLGADDRVLSTQTVSVVGGQQVQQALRFTLSALTPANDYYVILELDPGADGGVIAELNEGNNVVVSSSRVQVRQADLTISEVRVLRGAPPYDPVASLFMGEPGRFEARVLNIGGAVARDAVTSFYASDNESLNGVTDKLMGNVKNLTLAPGESRWVTLDALVPTTNAQGRPLGSQPYFVFASATVNNAEELDATNNFAHAPAVIFRAPAPNLVPTELQTPLRAGAGELVAVARSFSNFGNRDSAQATYRYYLSANALITVQDEPLTIVRSTGDVTEGQVTLAVDQRDSAVEMLRLPQNLTEGQYFIGAVIDPDDRIVEADETDNGLAGGRTTVVAAALSIANQMLPDATLGRPYSIQLVGQGKSAPYVFGAEASTLPPGLSVSASGVLSGTPTKAGAYGLTLTVQAGGVAVKVSRALRVASVSQSLRLNTPVLPAPIRGLAYSAYLSAAGGAEPYAFTVVENILPLGLTLSLQGAFSGTPADEVGTERRFRVRVVDALGNVDEQVFVVTVLDVQPFTIATRELPDAIATQPYSQFVSVMNPSGMPVARPVKWKIISGALPPGLVLEPSDDDTVFISGTPSLPGRARFTIEATDAQDRSDVVSFIVTVTAPSVTITGTGSTLVLPGDAVEVSFAADPMPVGASWFLLSGTLPPGVSFDPAGAVRGSIAAEASLGNYAFTVGVGSTRDSVASATPWTINVVSQRPTPSGCTTLDVFGLSALGLLWLVRRRRVAAR